jgi:DinB superfamily
MDAKTYVTYMLGVSHGRLQEAVSGVSEADGRRVLGGKLTPIVWQVGHIALVDGNYVRRAGGESPVPAGYGELFKQGSGGEQDYPPLAEVWNIFDATHRTLVDRASGTDHQAPVDAPSYKTVGEMLMYSSYHRGYHIGKIMTLRALLGKSIVR